MTGTAIARRERCPLEVFDFARHAKTSFSRLLCPHLSGRKHTLDDQLPAKGDSPIQVDAEHLDGGFANGMLGLQHRSFPKEELTPFIASGMKQPHDLTGVRNAGDVGTLERITLHARPSHIGFVRRTVMFDCDNMIWLKGKAVILLRHLAVLALPPGSLPNLLPELAIHHSSSSVPWIAED